MSETEGRAGAREGADEHVTDVPEDGERGTGTGGSLFKRMTSGEPQDRGVRRWVFAVGGTLVALAAAGFGVRQWRRRG